MKKNDKISPRLSFQRGTVVRVIGVGSSGENVAGLLMRSPLRGAEYLGAYTDARAPRRDPAPVRIQLGAVLTRGLGTGGDPACGRKAAEESEALLRGAVAGVDLLFIAAGLGGGTGTGAAPVIARIAKAAEPDALVIAVVNLPFSFEGRVRARQAAAGLEELRRHVDTLLIVPNDRIQQLSSSLEDAMRLSNEMSALAVRAIAEPVIVNGLVALDLQDVRVLMKGAGDARLGYGLAAGPGRALAAANEAIGCPLMKDGAIHRAKGALIVVRANKDIGLPEVDDLLKAICTIIPREARIKLAVLADPALKDELAVTIVATGLPSPFDESNPRPS